MPDGFVVEMNNKTTQKTTFDSTKVVSNKRTKPDLYKLNEHDNPDNINNAQKENNSTQV